MKRLLIIVGLGLAASPVLAQSDAVSLSALRVYNSPRDVASWPIRIGIRRVSMTPETGLIIETDQVPESWNVRVPGWGDGDATASCDEKPDGCINRTMWVAVSVNGEFAGSGFIQMWKGRTGSGTFKTDGGWMTEWPANWGYDGRWGALFGIKPTAATQLCVWYSAGDARGRLDVTSVRERSNAVCVPATSGSWSFVNGPQDPPVIVVPPGNPQQPPGPPQHTDMSDPVTLLKLTTLYEQAERIYADMKNRDEARGKQLATVLAHVDDPPWLQKLGAWLVQTPQGMAIVGVVSTLVEERIRKH